MKDKIFDELFTDLNEYRNNIIGFNKNKYFDYTASGLGFRKIENRISLFLEKYANTHSEENTNALFTQSCYNTARNKIKEYIGFDDRFYVFPSGNGATGAINHFQKLIGIYIPPKTKERVKIDYDSLPVVIIGPYEHHSNEISYRESLCQTIRIGLNKNDEIDFEQLERVLKENAHKELYAAFSLASNVTGIKTPYKELYSLLKRYNVTVCFDGAALLPYENIDPNYCDALVFSPHKLVGGPGSCGLLVIRKTLIDGSKPTIAGGGTVKYVNKDTHIFDDNIENLEDAGTPGIIQLIKSCLALQLRNEVGLDYIYNLKKELTDYCYQKLQNINDIILYSPPSTSGIISFNIKNKSPYDITKRLANDFDIQVRAGCSCAGPYGHHLLGIDDISNFDTKPGWIRVSVHFSHSKNDIDYLIDALKSI